MSTSILMGAVGSLMFLHRGRSGGISRFSLLVEILAKGQIMLKKVIK
jgi:hypothetical protein